jgi:hypothetical protein
MHRKRTIQEPPGSGGQKEKKSPSMMRLTAVSDMLFLRPSRNTWLYPMRPSDYLFVLKLLTWQSAAAGDGDSVEDNKEKRRSAAVERHGSRQLDHALEDFFDADEEEGGGKDGGDEDEEDTDMLRVVRCVKTNHGNTHDAVAVSAHLIGC